MTNFEKAVNYIKEYSIDSLKQLIEKDSSILDEKDEYGRTLLHIAIEQKSKEIVKLLLFYLDDLNIKDKYGQTALHYAIKEKDLAIVRLLLELGAKPDIYDNFRQTPMSIAIKTGQLELVRLLLEYRSMVNSIETDGTTLLHQAVKWRRIAIAKLLILHGADPYLRDSSGKTAVEYIGSEKIRNELLFLYWNRKNILELLSSSRQRYIR